MITSLNCNFTCALIAPYNHLSNACTRTLFASRFSLAGKVLEIRNQTDLSLDLQDLTIMDIIY